MTEDRLKELVFLAMGEVSMCWSETPRGVFDSVNAREIGERLVEAIIQESGIELQTKRLPPHLWNEHAKQVLEPYRGIDL